jgi:hypothetical protein
VPQRRRAPSDGNALSFAAILHYTLGHRRRS